MRSKGAPRVPRAGSCVSVLVSAEQSVALFFACMFPKTSCHNRFEGCSAHLFDCIAEVFSRVGYRVLQELVSASRQLVAWMFCCG